MPFDLPVSRFLPGQSQSKRVESRLLFFRSDSGCMMRMIALHLLQSEFPSPLIFPCPYSLLTKSPITSAMDSS